jgi:hypothetical protein
MSQANELLNPPKFVVARNKKEAEKSIHCFPSFGKAYIFRKNRYRPAEWKTYKIFKVTFD